MKQNCYTLQFIIDSVKSCALDFQSFEVMPSSLLLSLVDGSRIFLGLSYCDYIDGKDFYFNCEFSTLWLVHYYLSLQSISDVQFFDNL